MMLRAESRFGYVQVPREDYPYLLDSLKDRFGEVRRVDNVFWAADGAPRQVAVLLQSGEVVFPGKGNLLNPEKVPLAGILAAQKKKGRRIIVRKALVHCPSCAGFFAGDVRGVDVPSAHETFDGYHQTNSIAILSYPRYVPWRKPFGQRRDWINPQRLFEELAKSVGPQRAEQLVDLRLAAFREGIRVTPEELVAQARNPHELFPPEVFERAHARRDAEEARMVPRAPKSRPGAVSVVAPAAATTSVLKPLRPDIAYGEQTFLDWTVSYGEKSLTREQKLAVAVQFGIPLDLVRLARGTGLQDMRADRTIGALNLMERLEEQPPDTQLNEAVGGAVRDSILLGAEEEPQATMREQQKERWQAKRRHTKAKPSWKDHRPKEVTSVRRAQPGTEITQAKAVPQQAEEQKLPDLEQVKKAFFSKFNLTQADVTYQREDGFVKASKTIWSSVGDGRVDFFSVPLMPQRLPTVNEFYPEAMKVAEELARELEGRIVVCEQRKKGWKSLCVAVGNYTVRVAAKRLPSLAPSS